MPLRIRADIEATRGLPVDRRARATERGLLENLAQEDPDLVEEKGRYFITATQKTVARVHKLNPDLLKALWNQHRVEDIAQDGLVLELSEKECRGGADVPAPKLPRLWNVKKRDLLVEGRGGFTIDCHVRFTDLDPGQIIMDTHDGSGKGIALTTTDRGTVRLDMNDGWAAAFWECDTGLLRAGQDHHIVAIVDAGPRVITFVIDGVLCDGGDDRPFGYGRFLHTLRDVNGGDRLRVAPNLHGTVKNLRIYDRYLLTTEAIGNYRAGNPISNAKQ